MTDSSQTTLTDYLRTLRRSRWLIALVTLLAMGVAVAYVSLKTPKYEATAHETIRDTAADLGILGTQAGTAQLPLQLAAAHAPDVTRLAVLQQVKKDLDLDVTTDDVRSLVAVNVDPNSFAVNITGHDSDADDAAAIANAFAQADARLTTEETRAAYAASAKRLTEKAKAQSQADPTQALVAAGKISTLQGLAATAQPVVVSASAQIPDSPTSPKPLRDILAAAVLGLLLGVGIAYARSVFDRRLRDSSAVQEVFEYPVLARLRGEILGHTGSASDANVKGLGPLDPIDGEAFRMLRENLRYLAVDRDLRTIAVTSAVPEEGKSSVAACAAVASAGAGIRTLLVECDLRRPILASRFGLAEGPGLSDYLAARSKPGDILQTVPVPAAEGDNGSAPQPLVCITAGSPPPRPADVLSSDRFAAFLEEVGNVYERVIIDCPPILPVADTLEIIPHVECVLMCVRLNRTTRDQAEAAQEALRRLPKRPVGLVITDFSERDKGYYHGYYRYGEELASAPAESSRESQPA